MCGLFEVLIVKLIEDNLHLAVALYSGDSYGSGLNIFIQLTTY